MARRLALRAGFPSEPSYGTAFLVLCPLDLLTAPGIPALPLPPCARLPEARGQVQPKLPQAREDAYGDAVLEAARQTGLAEEAFPIDCPFRVEQTLDDTWWPA
jgi:hypothetical protein